MNIRRRNVERASSVDDGYEEARSERWRYRSRTLWRVNRWSLLSLVPAIIMIVVARIYEGEPESCVWFWISVGLVAFVLCSSVWSSFRFWRSINAMRRYYRGLEPPRYQRDPNSY